MRHVETILKLLFTVWAGYFILSKDILNVFFLNFLLVSLVLGIVLLTNKDSCYHFKQSKKDLSIRKLEGTILIVFSVLMSFMIMQPL